MVYALALAVGSVALGATLALLPGVASRGLGPVRTFALAAAGTVVLWHLLPEAIESVGLVAIAVCLAGFALPWLAEVVAHRWGKSDPHGLSAELGYAGLLLHQVGDGVGLWHLASSESLEAAVALAAHTIPVTALVVLRFAEKGGRKRGMIRAAGMAAASLVGVTLGSTVLGPTLQAAGPWTAAAVAGLLLHVIAHDLGADPPATRWMRLWDFVALCAGLALVVAGGHGPHGAEGAAHAESHAHLQLFHALADLAMAAALPVLAGVAVSALLSAVSSEDPSRWVRDGGPAEQACRGSLLGAAAPRGGPGLLAAARRLVRLGARPPLVAAYLFSAPAMGLATVALTIRFLGVKLALLRLIAIAVLSLLPAFVLARLAVRTTKPPESDTPPDGVPARPEPSRPLIARFASAFNAQMHELAPWLAIGLLVAAFVKVHVPADELRAASALGIDIPLMIVLMAPAYTSGLAVVPLCAVLLGQGVSIGAVLAGLLVAPVTSLPAITFLRRTYGTLPAIAAVFVWIAGVVGAAYAVDHWVSVPDVRGLVPDRAHEHAPYDMVAAIVLAGFLAEKLWRCGIRAWLATVAGGEAHAHGARATPPTP